MSLVVMAHPSREKRALDLAIEIEARHVCFDTREDEPNALRCARRAWQRAAEEGDWACVIQDDAIPTLGLNPSVIEKVWRDATIFYGPCAVALYHGAQSATARHLVTAYNRALHGFVRRDPADTYLATVGAIVPSTWVADWLAYSHTPGWASSTRDDECWGAYLTHRRLPSLVTFPCLVNHDNGVPSVAGNHAHGARYAAVPPPPEVPIPWCT